MTIWPREHERAWRNRRLLAERWHWPTGAVQECEWIEREHPEWSPWWQQANAWAQKAEGYYARRYGEDGPRYPEPYGVTPLELIAAMKKAPERYW
jgi:hypothetical protein